MSRKKIKRFPRLSAPPEELRRIEMILHITYNKLQAEKRFFKSFRRYDIYKVRKGRNARGDFLVLADTLYKEHIDPSLYLKVLAKYGKFENSKWLPNPSWLKTTKALNVFSWLIEVHRKRFVRHKDWINHLNDPGLENGKHIRSAIRHSWKKVNEVMDLWDIKIGTATIVLIDSLSPWFLAVCPSFHSLGGMKLLKKEDREQVQKCFDHIVKDKRAQEEALDEFGKFE